MLKLVFGIINMGINNFILLKGVFIEYLIYFLYFNKDLLVIEIFKFKFDKFFNLGWFFIEWYFDNDKVVIIDLLFISVVKEFLCIKIVVLFDLFISLYFVCWFLFEILVFGWFVIEIFSCLGYFDIFLEIDFDFDYIFCYLSYFCSC